MRGPVHEVRRSRRAVVLAVAVALAFGATACLPRDVGILAADDMAGRDAGKPGGLKARNWILGEVKPFTTGGNPHGSGDGRWLQAIPGGDANIVGVIPGTAKPFDFVVVGAHYDHLGDKGCRRPTPGDLICNGALDNATGVAAVLALMRQLHDHPPKRSVVVAFWDGEEDGYVGSRYYVAHPLLPLARTVAYLNADLLGENLVPGLHETTFALGSESGGARLQQLVQLADDESPVELLPLSRIFSEDRSDHASFLNVGIPSVFFGDGGGGCYHTPDDEVGVVDFDKLRDQTEMLIWLARSLANTSNLPHFATGNPPTSFDDAEEFLELVDRSWPDRELFSAADQEVMGEARDAVHAIVDAGRAAYDDQAQSDLVGAAVDLNNLLAHLPCDGYFPASGEGGGEGGGA